MVLRYRGYLDELSDTIESEVLENIAQKDGGVTMMWGVWRTDWRTPFGYSIVRVDPPLDKWDWLEMPVVFLCSLTFSNTKINPAWKTAKFTTRKTE